MILGVYGIFSFADARSAAQRLSLAHEDLNEVKQKLADIELLSAAPSVAAVGTEPPGATNDRIDAALASAGMPPSAKLSLVSLDEKQIDRTQYKEQKTIIRLIPSTLPKIVKFCDALQVADTGSVVSDLRLTSPLNKGNTASQELWEATLTLTQTIYSPKSK